MDFDLVPSAGKFARIHLPMVPVTLSYGGAAFPIGHALVDTGADITLLPMEVRKVLGVGLDEGRAIEIGSAGGGGFTAIPSAEPILYSVEKPGFRPIRWKGTVFFAPRQPVVLLGHYQCLDQLNVTVCGKQQKLRIEKA